MRITIISFFLDNLLFTLQDTPNNKRYGKVVENYKQEKLESTQQKVEDTLLLVSVLNRKKKPMKR